MWLINKPLPHITIGSVHDHMEKENERKLFGPSLSGEQPLKWRWWLAGYFVFCVTIS